MCSIYSIYNIYSTNFANKRKTHFFLRSVSSKSSGLISDFALIISLVLNEAGSGLLLGGIQNVGVVEEILDPQQDLLDGQGRLPVLLLVQDGETD